MHVKQLINSVFTSNTYIISETKSKWVWLIDTGETDGVLNYLARETLVKGVFITHPHFDHIYGINKLIDSFPDCIVHTSEQGMKGLFSDKLNLSYYHNEPIIFKGTNIQILHEPDKTELFENCFLETLETPGHNWGCLTYRTENYLFTGDSYIPNAKVVTKLKGGNKEASKKSLQKIMDNISKNTIICPGHGEMTQIKE
jgi:glyoxylase-like metal-dependent hydrolase (beta-lactamase superfamily II)